MAKPKKLTVEQIVKLRREKDFKLVDKGGVLKSVAEIVEKEKKS